MPPPTLGLARSAQVGDGRRITFSAAGPEDGFPVVYCHGAIGSPRWRVPGLDSVLERLGVRYVVVNRPGFGGSDPSPERSVVAFAWDLGEVMTALGHDRFAVVGVSAGAPYALACGWALANRVACLAAVSPLVPAVGVGATPGLRYQIPLAAFGSERLGPGIAALCLGALRLRGQTSTEAMIEDYVACRRAWGFDPGEMRARVTIWHGKADRLVPLRHALALAAAIPGARTCVDPQGGHFFYSRRLAEIIGSLLPGPAAKDESDTGPEALLRAA